MEKKYQTLPQFVMRPFGKPTDVNKDTSYAKLYTELVKNNKIRIVAVSIVESSYYFHIKIPSESQKNKKVEYDVVIRFFTDDPVMLEQPDLLGYKIQFFSNSPGFIYQYAYVYKQNGFLIEDLFEKLDGEYENIPPKKTNPNQVLSFDKSIYCATRYLNETRFRNLTKQGALRGKLIKPDKFFRDISDFQSVQFNQSIIAEEKKLKKELETGKAKGNMKTSTIFSGKKTAKSSTYKNSQEASIRVVKKKTGSMRIVSKKKAVKSTFKR